MNARKIFLAVLGVLTIHTLASGEWTEPMPVVEVNTEYTDLTPFLSYDDLSLYFARRNTGSFYYSRIYKATREVPYEPFTSISEVLQSSGQHVLSPWVSADNLRMYYHTEIESQNRWLLKVSTRTSVNDPWPQGLDISELNLLGKIQIPRLTADELNIFFSSYDIAGGQGGYDMWMASRPDMSSPFGQVTNLVEINTAANDGGEFVSPDGLTLYFNSVRNGSGQLFRATRQSLTQPFGNVEHLSTFDTPDGHSAQPCISSDGTALYFVRALTGETTDIYVSYLIEDPYEIAIIRIQDAIAEKLEALEKVNAAMEQEWAAYDALQELLDSGDYGDLSKGDIVTAMQKVYSAIQHQEQSINALEKSIEKLKDALAAIGWQLPQPVSYWTFDEGSGTATYDSVGTNDGTVYGATWTTGKINGALSFDGFNDYVDMADTVKNHLETNYTVSAWIKTKTISGIHGIAVYRRSTLDIGYQNLFHLDHIDSDVRFIVGSLGNNATASYPDAITANTWYHVAGVRKANIVNIYVNGVSGIPVSATLGAITPDNLKIGANDCCGHGTHALFNGTIDDVMIFDTALSAQEIQQLYNNSSAGL